MQQITKVSITPVEKATDDTAKGSLRFLVTYTCPYCGRNQWQHLNYMEKIKGRKYPNRVKTFVSDTLFCFDCKKFFPLEEAW